MGMYVITHKNFDYQSLPNGYTPLLVGANKNINPSNFVQDNTGINISDKNPSFCELTGLYWMWKNASDNNMGLSHYRRYFSKYTTFNQLFLSVLVSGKGKPVTAGKLDELLERYDWIVTKRQLIIEGTMWDQFAQSHHAKDMNTTREVIAELTPEYIPAFDNVMSQRKISYYNMFYTSKEELDCYASWLFSILFEVEKRVDISQYDHYQQRLFGFLAERLFNVWLYYRNPKIGYLAEYNSDIVGRNWALKSIRHETLGWLKPSRWSFLRKKSNH
ncbi:MAG: DUF4422 domain-containing protein [Limosilactobacillus oris]|jgi:hypothetical protein|uniref:DUF4422 domain-containing protein n=1 Tax=Limosilactobacillus oris TaxID=1632 RepID=UPI00242D0629|nr:DUF4422 domain-containing protein [Limosilactobacillus oris]MCH3910242.1 DUF4422 domain-containing protein [Limosilactobacillus oris]MCH3939369.1 DUF4422 domain-containing protein [Limosilactobacillus oris]MCI1980709.1 DUF4422 domain-containing protein [Limosilactobacillus oris]MCI2043103.1 DUF4422 domain-containing protein [Limosilactobacillus oris]